MGNHRVTSATAIGKSHTHNQDRHGWRELEDGSLILVIADGAGSAKHGGRAASEVVDNLLAWKVSKSSEALQKGMFEEMLLAQDALRSLAKANGQSLKRYNCTALLVHVSTQGLCHAVSVGDSWLTFSDEAGGWSFPLVPQKGQYANETRFLVSTEPHLWQAETWQLPLRSSMVLLTDGLDDVVLKKGQPYTPFFESFDRAMAEVERRAFWLESFLNSERVKARCADDRTILHLAWQS